METEKTQPVENKDIKVEQQTKTESSNNKQEEKIELEREYIVPLRAGFLKVQRYRRAKKAVKVLKEFIAKHMKVENRDTRNVKVDKYLNQEIWFRGIKNPLNKVKVKAVKKGGIVYVELAELPKVVEFQKRKLENRTNNVNKKQVEKIAKNEAKEKSEKVEIKQNAVEEKEKEQSTQEAGKQENKKQAKEKKHTSQEKKLKKDVSPNKKLK